VLKLPPTPVPPVFVDVAGRPVVVAAFVVVAEAVELRVLIQQSWKRKDSKIVRVDAIAGVGTEAAQTMASFGSGAVMACWEDNGQLH
jgi:uncharacterized membrane protein